MKNKGKGKFNELEWLIAENFRMLRRAGRAQPMMRRIEAELGIATAPASRPVAARRAVQ